LYKINHANAQIVKKRGFSERILRINFLLFANICYIFRQKRRFDLENTGKIPYKTLK